MYELLEMLYENYCTVPDTMRQSKAVETSYFKLKETLDKSELKFLLRIIDSKDDVCDETSFDSFASGFRLAWRLCAEIREYDKSRPIPARSLNLDGILITEDGDIVRER